MTTTTHEEKRQQVDASLAEWRQGDCCLDDDLWFLHRVNRQIPLTPTAELAAGGTTDVVETKVAGFMIVSQTCDVVRDCYPYPYVQVCALRAVDEDTMKMVASGHYLSLAYVPGIAEQGLVADLSLTMTLEKSVLVGWSRVGGCETDAELRGLQQSIARQRVRFAFPDDFHRFSKGLQDRLRNKHSKNSPEGEALRNLEQIRVRAAPSWDADPVELKFIFIHAPDAEIDFETHVSKWLEWVPPSGRFREVLSQVGSLSEISAKDYTESDRLDLDHLSSRRGGG